MADKESPVWITVLKLVAGAALLIGGVGFALWLASQGSGYSPALEQAKEEVRAKSPKTSSGDGSWGISKDSPMRK